MAKWTKAQVDAIEARHTNLLVAAAAGSGKTAVLVERIIKLMLDDHIGIDQMLIVTFSSAAAGEMRERIQHRLTEALKDHPDQSKFLRKQLLQLSRAYIMTLHAFCNDIVKKHFIEIGLDPSFRVGEVSTMSLLKSEALSQAMEKAYQEGDEDFVYLVESYGSNRSDQKLADLIERLYDFIQAQPEPLTWLRAAAEELAITKDRFDQSKPAVALMHYVKLELEGIIHLSQSGLEKCLEVEGPNEYELNFNSDLDQLERLKEAIDTGYSSAAQVLGQMSFTRLASIKKERKMEISELLLEESKAIRDSVKRKLLELKNRYFAKSVDQLIEELAMLSPKMKRLAEVVADFDSLYRALKQDQNLMDFNDLEHYALEILKNEGICELYRNRFACIFLDEYQDANIVQETIIERIKRVDNVFLVGDVKQSIYKFRLADPSLFMDKQRRYPLEAGGVERRVDLSMNFRTRGEILSVVNDFFARIMSEDLGEIPYDLSQYLYNGMPFPKADTPKVSLSLIDLGDLSEQEDELAYMKSAEIEAHFTAAKIKAALGTEVYHPKKGVYGQLTYKDMTVLLRSTKQAAPIYSEVFESWGIPVFIDIGSSFFEALEVNMVLSLLQIVDNRKRDNAWLTVLRSPFVGLKVDEMALIRSDYPEVAYHQAIQLYATEKEDALSDRLKNFIRRLDQWTVRAAIERMDEWLWQIFEESGFYAYCGAMPNGQSRQANLRLLLDKAAALEGQPESSLYHFIRVIERLEKTGGDMEAAKLMPEQEDAVRIMSIHKSKGLEFPLVIVSGLGKRFNLTDTYDDIMLHKHLGLGPKYVHWQERHFRYTFPQLAMRKQMTNEMLSEEMRILYVALTRPVDQLWLIGSVTNWQSAYKKWKMGTKAFNLAQGRSYLDWLGMYLFDETLNETEVSITHQHMVRNVLGLDDNALSSELLFERISVKDVSLNRQQNVSDQTVLADTLIDLVAHPMASDLSESAHRFLRHEEKEHMHLIPGKISVTALKALESEALLPIDEAASEWLDLAVPSWLTTEEDVSPAMIGTAVHAVLQHLSYQQGVLDHPQSLLESLVKKGLIAQNVAQLVQLSQIEAYLQSEMYHWLCQANRIEKEYPFVMQYEVNGQQTLVQGIIDLYVELGEKRLLVDFKTDRIDNQYNLTTAVNRHRAQLKLYSEAVKRSEGEYPSEVWLYFSSIGQWVQVSDLY